MAYRHTQIGTALLLIVAVVLLVLAEIAVTEAPHPFYFVVIALVVIVAALFSTLTVMVDDRAIAWHFTFGFWKRRIALSDIVRIDSVTNKWWWGLGIRMTPHGWLYNVSGLQAVEIERQDGRTLRIGTDEPEQLTEALRRAGGLVR